MDITELQMQAQQALEQKATAESALADLQAKFDELTACLANEQAQHADVCAKLTEANTKLESAETEALLALAEIDAKTAEVEKLKSEAKTAEQLAAKLAAESGLDAPIPVAQKGEGSILEQLASISNPAERAAFRGKHSNQISAELKKLVK